MRSKLILAGTGHRPDKIIYKGKNAYDVDIFARLVAFTENQLSLIRQNSEGILSIYSGMALGFDWALAIAGQRLGIPVIAAIPCEDQDKMWNTSDQCKYKQILKKCTTKSIYVHCGPYTSGCMESRNRYMVDTADKILAFWDGSLGGTNNCVKYAKEQNKEIINIYGDWIKYQNSEGVLGNA